MTTKVTWDTPLVQNQSIDIAACIQLDGVPATSQACVKPPKQSSLTRASHIPVQNIFGSNYDFFLVAELSASDFGIDPKEQMQQPISQQTITFNWTATPTHAGRRAIDIVIRGIWVPKKEGKQIEEYLGNHVWHVTVAEEQAPLLTLGQINISTLLAVLLTAVLNIPFWDFVKKNLGVGDTAGQAGSTNAGSPSANTPNTP